MFTILKVEHRISETNTNSVDLPIWLVYACHRAKRLYGNRELFANGF
jgi:hypothetical protein